jgi:hypothetical protein
MNSFSKHCGAIYFLIRQASSGDLSSWRESKILLNLAPVKKGCELRERKRFLYSESGIFCLFSEIVKGLGLYDKRRIRIQRDFLKLLF